MATHDYVIANQSGAAFRTDLNNALAAIVSNNSNSSEPATKYAYQWWADTSNAVMKIRNSANDGWIELFQLDGTLTLEDGTVSAPALAFRDDLNTGIFSSAADTFNVATAGVERMELGATTIFNEDGADVDFRIEGDTNANLFYVDAGNDRVGIGTSTPDLPLHVEGLNNADVKKLFRLTNTGGSAGTTAVMEFECGVDEIATISADNASGDIGNLMFATARSQGAYPVEAMRITSDGKLLVGLTTTTQSSAIVAVSSISGGGQGVITAIDSSSNNFGCGLVVGKNTTTTSSSQRFIQFYSDTLTTVMGGIVGNGANSVQFASISDERLKKNIKPLSGILEKINKIKTISFDWKDINESVKAGFIAQNVQEIFPEYVVDNMANEGEEKKLGTTGGMAGGYIAVLTAAIQELSAKVAALEAA